MFETARPEWIDTLMVIRRGIKVGAALVSCWMTGHVMPGTDMRACFGIIDLLVLRMSDNLLVSGYVNYTLVAPIFVFFTTFLGAPFQRKLLLGHILLNLPRSTL